MGDQEGEAGFLVQPKSMPDDLSIPKDLKNTPPEILERMASTYRERNKTYKDNYYRHGKVMIALFPDGVILNTERDFIMFGLLEQVVSKMTRFACSDLKHKDSIHDTGVYAAMIESLL